MKLKFDDRIIFIADDSPNAAFIKAGHGYSLDENGKLLIGPVGTTKTSQQIEKAIQKASTVEDLKAILLSIVRFIQ